MKFSDIIIAGIVVVALAVAAVLLPVRDIPSGEYLQLLKVEYEEVKRDNILSSFDDWSLSVPDISEKKLDIVEKTTKKEPAEKLPIVDLTATSLLEEEGFVPVGEPQEVQPGLMLTIYDRTEE